MGEGASKNGDRNLRHPPYQIQSPRVGPVKTGVLVNRHSVGPLPTLTVDHPSPVPMTSCKMLRVLTGVSFLTRSGFTVVTVRTLSDQARVRKPPVFLRTIFTFRLFTSTSDHHTVRNTFHKEWIYEPYSDQGAIPVSNTYSGGEGPDSGGEGMP